MTWLTYLIIAALLFAAELLYFRVADHFNIIDKPNARSSHTKVVLRGGGIIFLFGAWLWAAFFGLQYPWFMLGLTMIALVSFVDDVHSVPNWVRLIVQFAAMFLMFHEFGILQWDMWWTVIIALVVCVGVTNAYNFMDGINGINGGYTFAVLLPLAWLNCQMGFVDGKLVAVVLMADLVFCFFNFRPKGKARCFAGDVGSVGAAFVVLYVLGRLIMATGDITYIIFLAVYGVDSVLTIAHRIMLHENLGEAHRKHAYQIMANELKMEHTLVSAVYTMLQLLIAVGMVVIPDAPAWHWGYLIGVCVLLAVAYLLFMKRYYHLHEEYLKSLEG